MKPEQFKEIHNELSERKRVHDEMLNNQYHEAFIGFAKENSSMEFDKVYELTNDIFKSPRGCKRFVVYDLHVDWKFGEPSIIAGGWWLNNKTNIPQKWDVIPTYGFTNLPTVKLSENQTNENHPDFVLETQE